MLPALPPVAPFPRRLVLRALLALAGLSLALAAHALDVALETQEDKGWVWANVRVSDLFPGRVEESLARGMPATLMVHAELWRSRTGWFDALESAVDLAVKVRYDVWARAYRLERRDSEPRTLGTLDSVRAVLMKPLALPVARLDDLDPRTRYYVVVSVTLKPLSVEDLEEGEGWLSGEVATKGQAGIGIVAALPRALFDTVRNFAGFGDQRARAISGKFRVSGSR